ncbi:GNAT family N-acetyltransferase [Shewanella avicenniae]|uniref:GNAT family N-acetyltransferase n=1 Tax=Shewanella avicenniae TaxID=2814294 RepID=A0ABX7QWI0_9GAMM|nr:GNAT family N-acetyltransferase [Shewanella avicenniae]QSX34988.1 GNAT family N-acetyltransferase [Shewanella avicenniae]
MNKVEINIVKVNYRHPKQGADLLSLMQHYAQDPMGGGRPLSDKVIVQLLPTLASTPTALSLLAYQGERAVGLANCFLAFSTFNCAPILNIHDLVVHNSMRRQGVGQQLLAVAEQHAKALDCCKLTLEVLSGNTSARDAYIKAGFAPYQLRADSGTAEFWQKPLG